MSPEEARNHAVSERWEELFNQDVERMCDECYAEACVATSMATGHSLRGREHLRRVERGILATYPDRRLSITHRIASGDTVVVEGTWHGTAADAEQTLVNICVVLTFRDGQIISDRTYAPSASSNRAETMDAILLAAAEG